jgi:putative selenate reductase
MSLTPYPFGALVRRMFRELDERRSIFDLPLRRAVLDHPQDLSVRLHDMDAATPFGPAAGPHTQLAQNIVLSWLAGGRILELKTVQVRDDLQIPRPCIDMATVGYNVEWSQELRLEESLEEYVKALVLIRMLVASGQLPLADRFDRSIFDISVGYDLAGLRSPGVDAFLRGAADIRRRTDALRGQIPGEYESLDGIDLPDRLSRSATLSTFHGCPPGEIADMAQHLMREHHLHTIVKLNPMLLGPQDTRRLLHDLLGYHEIQVPDRAFANDTSWDQMLDLVGRLQAEARTLGLGFGIKLTNTLIVENHRGFFPASEREMYLSGPPLHVLTIELLRRVRDVFGPDLPISFSAGVDAQNFADVAALGLVPVTVCSDLLQPGGYGRAFAYFQRLGDRMSAAGAGTLPEFAIVAFGNARASLERAGLDPADQQRAEEWLDGLKPAIPAPAGGESAGAQHATGGRPATSPLLGVIGERAFERWHREAAFLNTRSYAAKVLQDRRYAAPANGKPPRKIGRRLQLFDCLTCDKCIPVCPNDAIFTFVLPRTEWIRMKVSPDGLGWKHAEDGVLRVTEKHQIAIFADFCNECGNCDVFCPEDGGPYQLKPVIYGSEESWRRAHPIDGFFVSSEDGIDMVLARFKGREFRLDLVEHQARFRGEGFEVVFDEDDPEHTIHGDAEPGVEIELVYFCIMQAVARALFAPGTVNYVNARADAPGSSAS